MKSFKDYIFEAMGRKRIIMIGGPGSGKSTYSEIITKKLDIPHIYTGDMMRKLAKTNDQVKDLLACLLYTSPSPRDLSTSRMPSSA